VCSDIRIRRISDAVCPGLLIVLSPQHRNRCMLHSLGSLPDLSTTMEVFLIRERCYNWI
jgi:hypothetical protein